MSETTTLRIDRKTVIVVEKSKVNTAKKKRQYIEQYKGKVEKDYRGFLYTSID